MIERLQAGEVVERCPTSDVGEGGTVQFAEIQFKGPLSALLADSTQPSNAGTLAVASPSGRAGGGSSPVISFPLPS